jgi:hypothetical protein
MHAAYLANLNLLDLVILTISGEELLTSIQIIQVEAVYHFVTYWFLATKSSWPPTTLKLHGHRLSGVRDYLFGTFAVTLHICSFIRNLVTLNALVTTGPTSRSLTDGFV